MLLLVINSGSSAQKVYLIEMLKNSVRGQSARSLAQWILASISCEAWPRQVKPFDLESPW
jgi:hypothetical protein